MCHQSWKSSIEREGNCKNCKTVIIVTAIIMAKGYSPLRGRIPDDKRQVCKMNTMYTVMIWMILKFRSLICLQSSVLVCKNTEPHRYLQMNSEQKARYHPKHYEIIKVRFCELLTQKKWSLPNINLSIVSVLPL